MTRYDEQPFFIKNHTDGADLLLPQEHRQRAHVGLAVHLAQHGEPSVLATILAEHDFTPETIEYLLNCIVPKPRGRPHGSMVMLLYSERLAETKRLLRASGERHGLHKRAMDMLEADAPNIRAALAQFGFEMPPLNREKLENYLRRSKKPRTKSPHQPRA